MANTPKNYYDILKVSPSATAEEVKASYRRLARLHHPDLHPESEKAVHTSQMQDVNEAYTVLGSPDHRKEYDALRNAPFESSRPPDQPTRGPSSNRPESAEGFSDFFRNMFGSAAGGSTTGPSFSSELDVEAVIELSLEDAVHGIERAFSLTIASLCPTCHGSGRIQDRFCTACAGVGEIRRPRDVKARIPAGLHDGSRIRLKGQGNEGPQGSGDLYLQIRLKADSRFKIEGDQLETSTRIWPWQAALGSEATIATLEGPVRIKIPKGTHSGQRLKLGGRGLGKEGARGDMLVRIEIDLPDHLSVDQERLYKELAEVSK